jgi:[protein-PII] uridylyltransferase
MKRYYWAAKAVAQLNQILLLNIEERLQSDRGASTHALRPINERFFEKAGMIEVASDDLYQKHSPRDPGDLPALPDAPRAARVCQREPCARCTTCAPSWMPPSGTIRSTAAPSCASCSSPAGITHAMRLMNQTSVLGRYLWVFRRIVGQMQHDLFHVYTVDQHILMVLRNMRRFFIAEHAHEYPFCSQLAAGWDKPWVLYVAALFHDIAKGRGGDHSELGAVEVRRFCREHGIGKDDTRLIEFLVHEHLTMSRIAQKEDLSNPDVIPRLCRARRQRALPDGPVSADRGRHPRHQPEGLECLERQAAGGPVSLHACACWEAARPTPAPTSRPASAKRWCCWPCMPSRSKGTRRSGTRLTWATSCATTPPTSPGTHASSPGMCPSPANPDAPSCGPGSPPSARACRWWSTRPINPTSLRASADTSTRLASASWMPRSTPPTTGFALDTFQVVTAMLPEHYQELVNMVESELAHTLEHPGPLPPPGRGRVSRRVKSFPFAPRVDLQPDEKAQRWLLSISASDRTGLLYSVARVLARHHINLQLAKITTLGERVEDTFLIDGPELQQNRPPDRDRNRTAGGTDRLKRLRQPAQASDRSCAPVPL